MVPPKATKQSLNQLCLHLGPIKSFSNASQYDVLSPPESEGPVQLWQGVWERTPHPGPAVIRTDHQNYMGISLKF